MISHIGKEANRWEEQFFTGTDENLEIDYGFGLSVSLEKHISKMRKEFGERKAAVKLGVSRMTVRKALKEGSQSLIKSVHHKMMQGIIE